MTVVCWDGKTLAADRQGTYGGTPLPVRKAWRVKDSAGRAFLYGAAGLAADAYAYGQWLRGKRTQPVFKDLCVLMVDEKRRIWYCDDRLQWEPINSKFWACGSGVDYALGAMAAGKSAREAVLIASRLCNTCGLGVDVVRF